MRNLLLKIFVLIFVAGISSCSSDVSTSTEEQGIAADLEKITKDYNSKQHRTIPAEYFEEEVTFGISDENFVILVGSEGNFNTSFKIQLEEGNRKNIENLESGKYKIAYLERDVILNNGVKTIYFAIDGKTNFADIASNADVYDAFGIAKWHNDQFKSTSSKAMALKMVDEGASCTCEPVIVKEEGETDCQSGGSGATSCSQGDCSVTCGSGTYACCNE